MLIIPVILSAFILRAYLIFRDSVPFAYDMGRDLLWSKDIAFYHTPTLLGPAASIWGVYFTPFWYYLLSVGLFLTNGHPLSAVYITAVTIILCGIIAYLFAKFYLGKFFAVVLSAIILFNAELINLSTFAFHANLLPLLTLLMIIFLFLAVFKNPLFLAASFFVISLMFSADPAPAVAFTFVPIFIFLVFKLWKRNLFKNILLSSAAYLLPLTPLLIFEIRNNFVQTKSIIAYFFGNNPSLSGQLPLFERVVNRLDLFWNFFLQSFAGGNLVWALLLIVIASFGVYRLEKTDEKLKKTLLHINLIFLTLTFLVCTFLITVEIKGWYMYGIAIPAAMVLTLSFYQFRNQKHKILTLLGLYLIFNLLPFFKNERTQMASRDPVQLTNQLKALDLIYSDHQGEPFSVYVFTPSIYDYNYQYLFWWYLEKKNEPMPSDFAYLPDVPDYTRNKNFYTKNPTLENQVYLIVENAKENEFYTKSDWLKNFADYEIAWSRDINSAITVEKRQK